jgi:hypothetical protein
MGVRRRLLVPPIDQVRPRFQVRTNCCTSWINAGQTDAKAARPRESGIAAAEKSSAAIPKVSSVMVK